MDNTIFDLQQSRNDAEFIEKNAYLELEVGAEILKTAMDIPYVGSLLKFGKMASGYFDYRFLRKLGRYLLRANEIPAEEVTQFVASLSPKEKKRLSDYLTQLLYTAEEDDKADVMGKIYVRRVSGEIDTEMMLRLCSIVTRSYLPDLNHLGEYKDVSATNTFVTDNLVALGLLADQGNVYVESNDGWESTSFGSTKHVLNEVGATLYHIMNDLPVDTASLKGAEGYVTTFSAITSEEIEEMFRG